MSLIDREIPQLSQPLSFSLSTAYIDVVQAHACVLGLFFDF
jgi:hypothetical protein